MITGKQMIVKAKEHLGLPYKFNGDFTSPDDLVTVDNVYLWQRNDPSHFSSTKVNILVRDFLGKLAGDCSGLITHVLGLPKTYSGDLWSMCEDRIIFRSGLPKNEQIPNIPGIIVWRSGHNGISLGDGTVIEAGSTQYGCTRTNINTPQTGKQWTGYGYLKKYVNYTMTTDISFRVQVTCSELNIRSTPNSKIKTNITGQLHHGETKNITEVSGAWGKTDKGWINLSSDYVKRV